MSMNAPVSTLPLFAQPAPSSELEKGRVGVERAAEAPGRALYLRMVRARMRALYRQRVQAYGVDYPKAFVSPDDGRAYLESLNPPENMSRNFMAAVFREPGWVVVGTYTSATKNGHGNKLQKYAWRG